MADFDILMDLVRDGSDERYFMRVVPTTPAADAAVASGMVVTVEAAGGAGGFSELGRAAAPASGQRPSLVVIPEADEWGRIRGNSATAQKMQNAFRGNAAGLRVRLLDGDDAPVGLTHAMNGRPFSG